MNVPGAQTLQIITDARSLTNGLRIIYPFLSPQLVNRNIQMVWCGRGGPTIVGAGCGGNCEPTHSECGVAVLKERQSQQSAASLCQARSSDTSNSTQLNFDQLFCSKGGTCIYIRIYMRFSSLEN